MPVGTRGKQTGAALIEFSFVLLPLLLLTLGILLYGLMFVTQQAMAFGAQRGADAMVQIDDEGFRDADGNLDVVGYCASGASLAANRVNRLLPNVGLLNEPNVDVTSRDDPQSGCVVTVTKDFPISIPLVPLPQIIRGVGFVPAS